MTVKKDVAVIGGGPGGYTAAIRCGQLGKSVVLFEEDAVGGTCMNYGCIPTKHLLHKTRVWREVRTDACLTGPLDAVGCDWTKVQGEKAKVVDRLVRGTEFVLERNRVLIVKSRGLLRDERTVVARAGEEEVLYEVGAVILATGSRPADLPFLKPDGRTVVTSRDALDWTELPKSLLVVGAGAIGIEMATIAVRMGTDVTVLEILPSVLPGCDREMGARLLRVLKAQGLKVHTEMRIESARIAGGRIVLAGTDLKTRAPFEFAAEKALLAAGRRPNTQSLHAGPPLVALDGRGFVAVDEALETNVRGIYAIGDLVGGKLLAHKASHEGLAAAAGIAGRRTSVDHAAIPMAVFTEPEFASVGLTEEEARQRTDKVRIGSFSFQANGRALTLGSPEGLVKIVADAADRILGAHLLGPSASEIIPELVLALRKGLTVADVADTVHIHPTLSEAVMEAGLKARGEAIHALNA